MADYEKNKKKRISVGYIRSWAEMLIKINVDDCIPRKWTDTEENFWNSRSTSNLAV